METLMAQQQKKTQGVAGAVVPHHVGMGDAAHAGMRHLSATGQQSVAVHHQADETEFAELQDEGPTARSPRPYNSNNFGR